VPVILDTDHVTLLQRQGPDADRLLNRLDQLAPDDIATTIVSFQEQVQGWLAYLNQARRDHEVLRAYAELDKIRRSFQKMNVLPFADSALDCFKSLRTRCRRLGTLDLRIASIALKTDSKLLTGNLRDFRQVPGLAAEDWTV
jgi:tRNA(fMet)-specific endonuclease VapC